MRKYLLIVFLFISFFPSEVSSQQEGTELPAEQFKKDPVYEISLNYEYGFDTDLDSGGKFNINRFSITGDYKKELNKQWNFSLDTSYNLTDYNFSGNEGLAGINPWNKIHRAGIGFRLNYQLNRKWGLGYSLNI